MTQEQHQNCPLCRNPARFTFADGVVRKHFFCKTCNEFQITRSAEKFFTNFPKEICDQFSGKARKSTNDRVFVIDINPNPVEPPSIQSPFGVFCDRDKLPRQP